MTIIYQRDNGNPCKCENLNCEYIVKEILTKRRFTQLFNKKDKFFKNTQKVKTYIEQTSIIDKDVVYCLNGKDVFGLCSYRSTLIANNIMPNINQANQNLEVGNEDDNMF